jgi:hypothetical protein
MHWAYVAGYFDGEGNASHYDIKRGGKTCGLSWHNTHKKSLEDIQQFMGVGRFFAKEPKGISTKTVFILKVSRRCDLIRVCDEMLPHLIVKKEVVQRIRDYAATNMKDESPNFGKVTQHSTDDFNRWYWQEGKSIIDIAKMLNVSVSSISQLFTRRGLKTRPLNAGHLKGRPKSEETKRRMRESRRRMWNNPEFRAAQLAMLAKHRALRSGING